MRAIGQELLELKSVVTAVLDPTGILLEANAGFMHLLGTSPARRIGANVALLFTKPAFAELAAVKAQEGGELYRGALKVVDAGGRILELPGRVWRTAFGICILAEYDIDTVQDARRRRELTDSGSREARLVEATLTDKVTGTANREKLEQSLATEISRVRRTGLPLSALMASIDRFTERATPDDQDWILARVGYLLRLLTRPTDIAARPGANEFVVLMPHTSLVQGEVVAERIRKSLITDPVEPPREPATASFGVAQFRPGEDGAAFLRRLQQAMRQAAEAGGDRMESATD